MASDFQSLKATQRKAVSVTPQSLVRTTSLTAGDTFPLVIEPEIDNLNLAVWAGHNREFVETHLLKHGAEVFAIEKDRRLCELLNERFAVEKNLKLIEDDALRYVKTSSRDWSDWKLVSNLPYSVASPILVELALSRTPPERLVATKYQDDDPTKAVIRTRPLCPYPQVATYKGSGDVNDAANFTCKQ